MFYFNAFTSSHPRKKLYFLLSLLLLFSPITLAADLPLYWWRVDENTDHEQTNFGDELSVVIVERIIGRKVARIHYRGRGKLLCIGSIIQFATSGDVVWGSGMNGKDLNWEKYPFKYLDVRAVRGPLTQRFLQKLKIRAPAVFGDPSLLLPRLFPEFQVSANPKYDYIVIPNIGDMSLVAGWDNVVLPTEPWQEIVAKILNSKFVIASSLHGIIVAEAFGIPARFLRLSDQEPDFKYQDYYLGTARKSFTAATSVEQALEMGGEPPGDYDLDALLNAFPYDYFL